MSAGKRSKAVLDFVGNDEIAISAFTIHEILFGLEQENESMHKFLGAVTVFLYDKQCAEISAQLDKKLTKSGTKIGIIDILIASVAIRNKLTLVTFDKAFSRVKDLDAKILSP